MNMEEYQKVKNLNYLEYCDYLQGKYGIGRADYMTKSFNKNQKVSRAKEGLYAHHKMENEYPCLSEKIMAKRFPWECQAKENIVYCDELEHLYLHILIAEISSTNSHRRFFDLSDAVQIMISNLFDVYSGYEAKVGWKRSCDDKVREDKDGEASFWVTYYSFQNVIGQTANTGTKRKMLKSTKRRQAISATPPGTLSIMRYIHWSAKSKIGTVESIFSAGCPTILFY